MKRLENLAKSLKKLFEEHEQTVEQLNEDYKVAQGETTDANAQRKELLDRYKAVEKEREELKAKIKTINSDLVEKERVIIMAKSNESEMRSALDGLIEVLQQDVIAKEDSRRLATNLEQRANRLVSDSSDTSEVAALAQEWIMLQAKLKAQVGRPRLLDSLLNE